MGTSKQLITALEKSDWMDRLLILAGLAFFILVVLFILKQRIVDRGLRVALWWTRFIPNFRGDADDLKALERGDVLQTVTAAASSIATAVVAVSSVSSGGDHLSASESSSHSLPPSSSSAVFSTVYPPDPAHETQPVDVSEGVHDEL